MRSRSRTTRGSRVAAWLSAPVLLCAALISCAAPPPAGTPGSPDPATRPRPDAARLAPATGNQWLAGVCPATVVIQDSWAPGADQAAEYQLVGPGALIDAARKRVTGPLVDAGRDTGVRVEIRSGGAAIGFAPVPARMYVDHSITLGEVRTDLAVATETNQPVTAVVATETKSPQILMWDPASHPGWHTIADIGASTATVLVAKDSSFIPLLVSKGLIKAEQVDAGYTGAPARFVADPSIAQQGYATEEPYLYQHEISQWRRPVEYQLLADAGYTIYPAPLSVRAAELAPLSPCLRRLVPIIQRAQIEYLAHPVPTNRLIVDAAARYNNGWPYSLAVANYAASVLHPLGIVANDTSGPLGGIDLARVQAVINTYSPLLAVTHPTAAPGLAATDIATTAFIDPAIHLP